MANETSDRSPAAHGAVNARVVFVASCVSLIATAMCFAIRGDILGDLKYHFTLNDTQLGWVGGAWAWGFALAILFGGPLCDVLGMGRIMYLAFAGHALGIILTVFAPGFAVLFAATLIVGIGNGMVEAAINPLVATLYPNEKTARLNMLHAWFPGGIVIGGLVGYGISQLNLPLHVQLGGLSLYVWQIKMLTILLPVAVYGIMFAGRHLPPTERVAAGISTRDMFREAGNPMYLVLLLCMACTASTELGPNNWMAEIMKRTLPGMATAGILVLVWINLVMCIGRFFAGPLAHKLSPTGIILCGAVVSGVGLLLLSVAGGTLAAFAAALVFALGVCYFWPTMLGITSERFPRGGALLLAMTGAFGNISVALVSPGMGRIIDITGEPKDALRYTVVLPILVVIIMGAMFLRDRARGGYKQVKLDGSEGGAQ